MYVTFTTMTVEKLITIISGRVLPNELWSQSAQQDATTPQDFRGLMFAGQWFPPGGPNGAQSLFAAGLQAHCTVTVHMQPRRVAPGLVESSQVLYIQFPCKTLEPMKVTFATMTVEELITVIRGKVLSDARWMELAQQGATAPQEFRGLVFKKLYQPDGPDGSLFLSETGMHIECTAHVLMRPRQDNSSNSALPLTTPAAVPCCPITARSEVPNPYREQTRGPPMIAPLGALLLDSNGESLCVGDLVMIPPATGDEQTMGIALFNLSIGGGVQLVQVHTSANYSQASPSSLTVYFPSSTTLGPDTIMLDPRELPFRDALGDLVLCGMGRPLINNCLVEKYRPWAHSLFLKSAPPTGRVTGITHATGGNALIVLQLTQGTGTFPPEAWRCNHSPDGQLLPYDRPSPAEEDELCPEKTAAVATRDTSSLPSAPTQHSRSEPASLQSAMVDLGSARLVDLSRTPFHTKAEKAAKFPPAIPARSLTCYHLQESCEVYAGPRDTLQTIVLRALELLNVLTPPLAHMTVSFGPSPSSLETCTDQWDAFFLLYIDPSDTCVVIETRSVSPPRSPDSYTRETEHLRLVDCTNLYQILKVSAGGSSSDIHSAYHYRLAVLKDSDDLSGYLKRQYAAAYGVIGEPSLRKEYDAACNAGVPDCANLFTASESSLSVISYRNLAVYFPLTRAWGALKCRAFKVAVPDRGSPAGTIAAVLTALRRRQAATLVAFVRAGSPGPANLDDETTITIGFADAKDMSEAIGLVAKPPWGRGTPDVNVKFSVEPESQGSELTILHGRRSPTAAGQVTIFLCDRARNHFIDESSMTAPCPADYGTSHQPDQTCAYWAHHVLITKRMSTVD